MIIAQRCSGESGDVFFICLLFSSFSSAAAPRRSPTGPRHAAPSLHASLHASLSSSLGAESAFRMRGRIILWRYRRPTRCCTRRRENRRSTPLGNPCRPPSRCKMGPHRGPLFLQILVLLKMHELLVSSFPLYFPP